MSKWLLLISLLFLLASACTQQVTTSSPLPEEAQPTQPAPSKSVQSEPTLSIIAAWTELALTKDAIVRPTETEMLTVADTATAAYPICPGAPGPYVAVGRETIVTAENVDKLKLRSAPDLSDETVIGELERFTQLEIVGGPICVRSGGTGPSYWFWQVEVLPNREVGWVAEGDVQHSFIAVSIGEQYIPQNTPTTIATTTSACGRPHAPFSTGLKVTVITDNSDKLKLRSEPEISAETVIRELDLYTQLEIVGGPLCVQADETSIYYWLWKVKDLSRGTVGWVAEGDGYNRFLEPNWSP